MSDQAELSKAIEDALLSAFQDSTKGDQPHESEYIQHYIVAVLEQLLTRVHCS